MATFSPSPAPRRTSRQLNKSTAGGPNSPPTGSRKSRLVTTNNGYGTSRIATPSRLQSIAGSVAGSAMEIDEINSVFSDCERGGPRLEAVFAKSEELSVAFYAHLPVEVKQVLKNADFYAGAYSGTIDTQTGFALVASSQTCFVWQHAQAVKGTPTCYIFSCPQDDNNINVGPFHALVPYGISREPGLILISPGGEIRFWDSIGIGLAGGEHFLSTSLGLIQGEDVTSLVRSDHQTYIASSSSGRLFRLTLTSTGGKHHLTSHAFSRPSASSSSLSLSRFVPSLWAASSNKNELNPEPGNINAVALGADTGNGKAVWALVNTRLTKWNMLAEGWEEPMLDQELLGTILVALKSEFPSAASVEDNDALDLELLDLAIQSDGAIVILVSYAGTDESTSPTRMDFGSLGVRRIYALVRLTQTAYPFQVQGVSPVPYQTTSLSGAPMHARMQLILDGRIVAVQFGDAVAICARDSLYADRLELRLATDSTLGVGVVPGESVLLVLSAGTMMKAYLNIDKLESFDVETGRADLIKSIMTQAILYGSLPENPLQFSFPPSVPADSLMEGAMQLSSAVLCSDPSIVRRDHDLSSQLSGRKDRLGWLIRFINDNGALGKMSQKCRQRLSADAEKLYAASKLWSAYDRGLASGASQAVLGQAVHQYMDQNKEYHEDIMRAFFRLNVADVGSLLPQVMDIVRNLSAESRVDMASPLTQANGVVLTILPSAFDYRSYNRDVYGISLPMLNPWTSKLSIIDTVKALFDATVNYLEGLPPGSGAKSDPEQEPSSQLPELATVLFSCIQERLEWLGSPVAQDDNIGSKRERDELNERFKQLRPSVLETLRMHGHESDAFALAELQRDFRTLASLCHKSTIYPPQDNPNLQRIQRYIDTFKEDFTTELYRWYIEQGEVRVMFAQEDVYGHYLDLFFSQDSKSNISWINDLGKGRLGVAAQTLLQDAEDATDLQTKHLMLSVGKLCHLAQLQQSEANVNEVVLDAFHDELDFVSVHESLVEQFKAALAANRKGKHSLDSQVDAIVKQEARLLVGKNALTSIFKQFVRELMQGKALSIEDAVDILTLKDNGSTIEDYATALHLLARVNGVPEARRFSACQAVWRRTYIHDDWNTIRKTANISDTQLTQRFEATALCHTLRSLFALNPEGVSRPGYDLRPTECLDIPTHEEVTSRWPGMAPEQVEAVLGDYHAEREELAELELEDVYHRVRELVGYT